ncbi:phage tail tape measure protein [Erwinia sp. MYb416]|uniref:phage tail tape measure protein n=1 Tax=Erwinia sp. MYb416 TaxID=3108532 RepID=UPI0030B5B396
MSNNLRLQVLLKAVDQASRPFKAIQTETKKLSGDIRDTQASIKAIDAQAAKIDGFRKTSGQLAVTQKSLKKAKEEAAALAVQFRNTEKPTTQQARALEQARKAASDLQAKSNALRLSVQQQRDVLTAAGISTKSLSSEQQRLKSSSAQATLGLSRQRQALQQLSEKQAQLNRVSERYEKGKAAIAGVRNTSAAALGVGTAAMYAGSRLIAPAVQTDGQGDRIAAQNGEGSGKGEQYTRVIRDISGSGTGNDISQISEAVAAVRSTLGALGDVGESELNRISRKALDIQTTLGGDTTESIQIAAIMMKNGLAKNSDEAFDLMVTGMQKVSTQMRGELPEILHEYSTHFRNMGFSGSEAMSLLVDMAQQGKFALDKTGDAVKEFSIRGSDMSKNSVAAYQAIGLNAKKMSSDIASGGDKARLAMQKTAQGLMKIKDPATRANQAIALFGTPIEDLSVDQIPAFLAALAGTKNKLGDVSGAADRMGATLRDNLQGDIGKLQGAMDGLRFNLFNDDDGVLRKLTQEATGWLNRVTEWVKANPKLTQQIVLVAGAAAALIAVLGGVGLVIWPVMTGINMLVAGAGLLGTGFSVVGSAIVTALGAITLPVALVAAAIVAGALLIRKYWEPISAFLSGMAQGFTAAMGPIADAFSPLKPVFDWLGEKLGWVWDQFKGLLEPVKSTQAELQAAGDMGKQFGELLAAGIKFVLSPLTELQNGIDWVLKKLGMVDDKSKKLKDNLPTDVPVGAQRPGVQYNVATGGAGYRPVTAPAGGGNTNNVTSNDTYNINMPPGISKDDALALIAEQKQRDARNQRAAQNTKMGWE